MVRSCFAAAMAACALAPVARAAEVRVVNERGLPQAALWTDDAEPPRFLTDADGWIRDVRPGATLRVTRSTETQPCHRNQGGAPEGPEGVSFTVTEAGGTITLPNATGPSHHPDSSEAERWIVGKINELRAQRGAPPVRVSAILNRVADSVARRQAVESLSFPPPFCPVVVVDWGFPVQGYGSVDANGTDPRKAWEHWSDGSGRETMVTLPDFNAVGVGDGGGAWTAYLAECPADLDARCEMIPDQGDPRIELPGAPAGGRGPAPAAMGALTIAARQRGRAVRGTVEVGRAGSTVAVRLKRGTRILGKLLERDVAAGRLSLKVALDHRGKRLLRARKTLGLVVEVVVDPPAGTTARASRSVKLRR